MKCKYFLLEVKARFWDRAATVAVAAAVAEVRPVAAGTRRPKWFGNSKLNFGPG